MVRGNFIALNGYIRKQGGFEIRYLRFNVRSPVKYDQIKTISSWTKDIKKTNCKIENRLWIINKAESFENIIVINHINRT